MHMSRFLDPAHRFLNETPGLQTQHVCVVDSEKTVSVCVEGITSETENHDKKDILVLVEKGR